MEMRRKNRGARPSRSPSSAPRNFLLVGVLSVHVAFGEDAERCDRDGRAPQRARLNIAKSGLSHGWTGGRRSVPFSIFNFQFACSSGQFVWQLKIGNWQL